MRSPSTTYTTGTRSGPRSGCTVPSTPFPDAPSRTRHAGSSSRIRRPSQIWLDRGALRAQTASMPKLRPTVDAERRREVEAALRAFNTQASPVMGDLRARGETDSVPLDVYAVESVGGEEVLVGGLVGATWARVARGRAAVGAGGPARLRTRGPVLAEAERIAWDERRCIGAHLSTWDFQARPFYEAHGYVVFGVLEDHPPGVTDYYLAKRLADRSGGRGAVSGPGEARRSGGDGIGDGRDGVEEGGDEDRAGRVTQPVWSIDASCTDARGARRPGDADGRGRWRRRGW